jgi:hypothetical protein
MAETKPNVSAINEFDSGKLKRVITKEKNTLPSDESKFCLSMQFRRAEGEESLQ